MNDNNVNYTRREEYESEIDLMNLLGHILIRWKLILAVAIVCGCIGGLIGFIRSENSDDYKPAGGEEAIVAAAEGLSEAQKAEAEEYYEQMLKYDQMIENHKKLYDESYYMNLDPNTAIGCHLWYMLETDLGNATSIYSDILTDDDYRKIADVLGTDKNMKYLKEAVTFWSDETMDTYNFDLTNTDRQVGNIKNEYKLLYKVTITAPDRASGDKIAQIADEAVARETEILERYGVAIKCTKLTTRTYDTELTERIIGNQLGKINALGNLETNRGNFYNNIVAKVNEDEKAYIDALYSNTFITDQEKLQKDVNENKFSMMTTLKYVTVSACVGIFAVVCLIASIYIFKGVLHEADEIKSMGIPVLQTLADERSERENLCNDIISDLGRKIIGEAEVSPASFSIFMEEFNKKVTQGIKTVYIAVDKSAGNVTDYARKICEMEKEVICYTGGIVPDAEDMKHLLTSDSVLLLPTINNTKIKSIVALADICDRNRIYIIGSAPVMIGAR